MKVINGDWGLGIGDWGLIYTSSKLYPNKRYYLEFNQNIIIDQNIKKIKIEADRTSITIPVTYNSRETVADHSGLTSTVNENSKLPVNFYALFYIYYNEVSYGVPASGYIYSGGSVSILTEEKRNSEFGNIIPIPAKATWNSVNMSSMSPEPSILPLDYHHYLLKTVKREWIKNNSKFTVIWMVSVGGNLTNLPTFAELLGKGRMSSINIVSRKGA